MELLFDLGDAGLSGVLNLDTSVDGPFERAPHEIAAHADHAIVKFETYQTH